MTVEAFARFPARVLFSDGRLLRKAAVVVRESGVVQVAERAGGGVSVVFDSDRVEGVERQPDRTTLITLDGGLTLKVGKGDGCSCGSPLKTWYSQRLREAP